MLYYTSSKTSLSYMNTIRAARLVPEHDTAGLPSPFGEVGLEMIHNPERLGLKQHPIQQIYPNIVVQYYLLVIREGIKVQRGDVRGVSLYADYNGSNVCAEITSEMGRNGVAPWTWQGEPNSPTDPAATARLEWRRVEEGNASYTWMNHAIHGNIPGFGADWRDGVPLEGKHMYDPARGEVMQSILVPVDIPGLGTAEQTVSADALRQTYNILLWFPKRDQLGFVQRAITEQPRYDTQRSFSYESTAKGASRGVHTLGVPEAPQAEFKMAAGGKIKQHIRANPFGPNIWENEPEVMFVCLPVGESQADRLLHPDVPAGRHTF